MKVYTYSQARKKLSRLLDEAGQEGQIQIKRRNGQAFVIRPVTSRTSPLEVEGIEADISLDELNEAVRESRRT